MKRIKLSLFSLIAIASVVANAGDLKAPFAVSNAKVLPIKVRNLSYKGLFVAADEKIGDNKINGSLAAPFFKEITFNEAMISAAMPESK